jgi:hypothetical protein
LWPFSVGEVVASTTSTYSAAVKKTIAECAVSLGSTSLFGYQYGNYLRRPSETPESHGGDVKVRKPGRKNRSMNEGQARDQGHALKTKKRKTHTPPKGSYGTKGNTSRPKGSNTKKKKRPSDEVIRTAIIEIVQDAEYDGDRFIGRVYDRLMNNLGIEDRTRFNVTEYDKVIDAMVKDGDLKIEMKTLKSGEKQFLYA